MTKRHTSRLHTPTIKVKRQAAPRRFLKRLSAVTRGRNQRVAAAANAQDLEEADHSSRISKGLTIIFGVHILAIGAYFFHLNFLSKRTDDPGSTATAVHSIESKAQHPPMIGQQDRTVLVVSGDTYATIAKSEGITEQDLRAANQDLPISAGIKLIVPPKRITAALPPSLEELRHPATGTTAAAEDGLVDANPVVTEPASQAVPAGPVTVKESAPPKAIPVNASGTTARSYTVRPGDTVWGISHKLKVDQAALMRLNGITNPNKIKIGMTLKIPN